MQRRKMIDEALKLAEEIKDYDLEDLLNNFLNEIEQKIGDADDDLKSATLEELLRKLY